MYSVDERDKVIELENVPQSSAGAPLPFVMSDEHMLLLAYIIQGKPYKFDGRVLSDADLAMFVDHIALIEFGRYRSYMFGSPNDEAFNGHPLASRGLHPYGAFQIEDSSWIRQLERMNSVHRYHKPEWFERLKHFVFAFHDSTFECVADGFKVSEHEGTLESVLPIMQSRLQW